MDLQGKTAVVTGAGGLGCGRMIALRLAREGALVVASDLDKRGVEETVARIEAEGGRAAPHRTDVSVRHEVDELIAFSGATFGGLDILVNNASAPYGPQGPLEGWFDAIQVDLLGPMYATLAAVPAMRKRGGGAILNIGSTSALGHGRKHSKSPGYDVAKAGVTRLTTTLQWLKERDNIRVNCLVPDWVATPEVKAYWDALTVEQRRESGAPGRLTTLEEIAGAAARLITDETLAGRILIYWSEDGPKMLPWADPGFAGYDAGYE
jgi:NAD(P)-dependent dehydrogenase (short-subunit alcohol dehydrogenase family)